LALTNTQKLKGRIVEKNLTQNAVARCLGIDNSFMSYKLQNKTFEFTQDEVKKICELLEIENPADFFETEN
jgi:transcriptional regulator with XRE-family HTH domain